MASRAPQFLSEFNFSFKEKLYRSFAAKNLNDLSKYRDTNSSFRSFVSTKSNSKGKTYKAKTG